MEIKPGPHWEQFIAQKIQSGQYCSASEVVRDGLRLLEELESSQQNRSDDLRRKVREGIEQLEQGEYIELDTEELQNHLHAVKEDGRYRLARDKAAGI